MSARLIQNTSNLPNFIVWRGQRWTPRIWCDKTNWFSAVVHWNMLNFTFKLSVLRDSFCLPLQPAGNKPRQTLGSFSPTEIRWWQQRKVTKGHLKVKLVAGNWPLILAAIETIRRFWRSGDRDQRWQSLRHVWGWSTDFLNTYTWVSCFLISFTFYLSDSVFMLTTPTLLFHF